VNSLLLGLFGLGLFPFANGQVHRFERLAAQEIGTKIGGEARLVKVKTIVGPEAAFGEVHRATLTATRFDADGLPLFTEPQRSKSGQLRTFEIDLSDFTLRGLHVDHLRATLDNCRFDLPLAARNHMFRLSRSGSGPGEVVVSDRDLGAFILQKFYEVKTVFVKIENGRILVQGHGEFLLLSTDFEIDARLQVEEGTKLVLRDARIKFDGQPAGDELNKVLLDTLNPVVDLDQDLGLHGAMNVDRLILKDGLIRALGSVTIPNLPGNGEADRPNR